MIGGRIGRTRRAEAASLYAARKGVSSVYKGEAKAFLRGVRDRCRGVGKEDNPFDVKGLKRNMSIPMDAWLAGWFHGDAVLGAGLCPACGTDEEKEPDHDVAGCEAWGDEL